MRSPPIIIRPSAAPASSIDLTQSLIAAVAHELWKHGGGNDVVNWVEAERFVREFAFRGVGARSPGDRASAEEPQVDLKPGVSDAGVPGRRSSSAVRSATRPGPLRDEFAAGPLPLL